MSYPGRQWLELYARQEAKIEADYWKRHADCLTPAERQRLRNGDYAALKRPVRPSFTKGQRIEPVRGLTLEVASVEPSHRHDGYLVKFGRIEDFRNSFTGTRGVTSDPDIVTTLYLVNPNTRQAEPGRIDREAERELTRASRANTRRELEDYIAAMEELRFELDKQVKARPGLAKTIGRELWQIRGRIDAAKARLKRQMVA